MIKKLVLDSRVYHKLFDVWMIEVLYYPGQWELVNRHLYKMLESAWQLEGTWVNEQI